MHACICLDVNQAAVALGFTTTTAQGLQFIHCVQKSLSADDSDRMSLLFIIIYAILVDAESF